ncbi:MAG: HPr family phosphocarrier protein [Lachnospiraceae bacterium]|nr:HPr family phosphocarrier protein [Lachnospiraceae bacterium]
MKEFSYTISDAEGIHARPAGELVKLAKGFKSAVTISKGAKSGNATKIFAVMGLGAKQGETVDFKIEGEDEEAAAAAIESFMKENL